MLHELCAAKKLCHAADGVANKTRHTARSERSERVTLRCTKCNRSTRNTHSNSVGSAYAISTSNWLFFEEYYFMVLINSRSMR